MVGGAEEPAAVAVVSGLVVVPEGEGTLVVVGVGEGAAVRRVPMRAARGLFALRAVGERVVAVAQGRCEAGPCLVAQLLSGAGSAVGEPAEIAIDEPLVTRRVRATEDAVLIARSHVAASPSLDRIAVVEDGLRVTTTRLGEAHDPAGRRVEILGLAAEGGRWAVAWRAGATEATDSDVFLTTHTGEHEVEPLHHALVLESFEWRDDALHAIAAFEFSRPQSLRLRPDGTLDHVHGVEAGAGVPYPFETRRTASLRRGAHGLLLELRDGAGDRVGAPLRIAETGGAADVTRSGDGYLVAFARSDGAGWSVAVARVSCDAGGSTLSD